MLHIPDSRLFTDALTNHTPSAASLFEPFLPDSLTEQLIWRRGPHLFAEPEVYADTMISLRERTAADVVCIDADRFPENALPRLLSALEAGLPEGAKAVILSRSDAVLRRAEDSSAVCAVGGAGDDAQPHTLPFIRMDKTPEYAVREGASGWFAKEHAETYYRQYHTALAVCAGLGAEWVSDAEPMAIYRRVGALCRESGCQGYLPGSGGVIRETSYLSLISLLGIFARLH